MSHDVWTLWWTPVSSPENVRSVRLSLISSMLRPQLGFNIGIFSDGVMYILVNGTQIGARMNAGSIIYVRSIGW